jgi:hypothetical protein
MVKNESGNRGKITLLKALLGSLQRHLKPVVIGQKAGTPPKEKNKIF